jgi:hypothetical protein
MDAVGRAPAYVSAHASSSDSNPTHCPRVRAKENPMPRRQRSITLSFALLLTTSVPALAHESALEMAAPSSVECGGQYECRADAPLTLQEAMRSIAYPDASPSSDHAASVAAGQRDDALGLPRSSPGG